MEKKKIYLSNGQFARSGNVPVTPISGSYWVRPGLLLAGEYPISPFDAELSRKRIDSFLLAGIDTFINLTRQNELPDYSSMLMEQAGYFEKDVFCHRFPIGDFGVPDPLIMMEILKTIDTAINAGHAVYYHCYAGIGRTGTVTGCYLVEHGLKADEALQTLSEWWKLVPKSAFSPNSPETNFQIKFIQTWADHIK